MQGKDPFEAKIDLPDRFWYGNRPKVIAELRGKEASSAIEKIKVAVENYPYKTQYDFCPGPNSNTFTAYIAREVPELNLTLSPLAVGKDYLPGGKLFALTPSGSGFQVSLKGLFSLTVARNEGFEISIAGFVFGVNPKNKAILLPGIGELCWPSKSNGEAEA